MAMSEENWFPVITHRQCLVKPRIIEEIPAHGQKSEEFIAASANTLWVAGVLALASIVVSLICIGGERHVAIAIAWQAIVRI
jgi:hypothetical protein